jgi:hypothetical protein
MGQFYSVADLETIFREIRADIRSLQPKVTHGTGPPPARFVEPYVDDLNSRVYYYVNGVAKSASLT